MKPQTVIYTDGSYAHTSGLGGWAYVVTRGRNVIEEKAGKLDDCKSNNVAELTAILRAVQRCIGRYDNVIILTDSQYAVNVLTGIEKTASNRELVNGILALAKNHHPGVKFRWVKGHNGDRYNTLADKLATAARKAPPSLSGLAKAL